MVNMQMLRAKLNVLDMSYGNGTGGSDIYAFPLRIWLCISYTLHPLFLLESMAKLGKQYIYLLVNTISVRDKPVVLFRQSTGRSIKFSHT